MEKNSSSAQSGFENPPVTLKDIVRKIIRARWWIFISIIVILTGTIYVSYSTPPIYQATVSVMIEKTSKAETIFNFGEDDNACNENTPRANQAIKQPIDSLEREPPLRSTLALYFHAISAVGLLNRSLFRKPGRVLCSSSRFLTQGQDGSGTPPEQIGA